MKPYSILIIILLASASEGFSQESNCRVLKAEISGSYSGGCKKGFAHGYGTATGVDTYTGHFVKGYPEGEGEYHYKTGEIFIGKWVKGEKNGAGKLISRLVSGRDSITQGIWKADKFIGKEKGPEYVISNESGSVFPRIHNLGPGNKIELTFEHPLGNNVIRNVQIMLSGAATSKEYYGMRIYEDVQFPFELSITYTAPNKINTGTVESSIRIRFLEPAYWKVILKN